MSTTTRQIDGEVFEAADADWPQCKGYGATREEAKRDLADEILREQSPEGSQRKTAPVERQRPATPKPMPAPKVSKTKIKAAIRRIKAATLKRRRFNTEGTERLKRLADDPHTAQALAGDRPEDYCFIRDLFALVAEFNPPASLRESVKAREEQEKGYQKILEHLRDALYLYRDKVMLPAEFGGFEPAPERLIEEAIEAIEARDRGAPLLPGADDCEPGDVSERGGYSDRAVLAHAINRLADHWGAIPKNRGACVRAWLACAGYNVSKQFPRSVLRKGKLPK